MEYRTLGRTGFKVSEIGFGGWAIGGGWGPQDDDESIAAIHHAVDLGVTWVDTAAVYGLGHSEEVVGRAVRALPADARPLVFTKCALEWDDADPMAAVRRLATPHTVRHGIEGSLRRLGTDAVDLFQIHWPDDEDNLLEDAWAEMVKLPETTAFSSTLRSEPAVPVPSLGMVTVGGPSERPVTVMVSVVVLKLPSESLSV